MAQQINLLDPSLRPRRDALGAERGLLMVGLVFAGSAALSAGLQWHASRLEAQTAALPTVAAAPAAAAPAASEPAGVQAELQRLRDLERQQQRVRTALASGVAGSAEGYAPYLKALSRQAQGSLWITAFAVTAEGQAIELEGRMTDASVLPAYLRRLNAEERFHGRPFAQLQIRTQEQGVDGPPITEFALRSQPGAQPGAQPAAAPARPPAVAQVAAAKEPAR